MSTILLVVLLVVLVAFGAYVIKTKVIMGVETVAGQRVTALSFRQRLLWLRAAGGSANVPPSPSGRKGSRIVSGSALPAGWSTARDSADGTVYYYNKNTGQSQWDRPGSSV